MPRTLKNFGNYLKIARLQAGLNQREVITKLKEYGHYLSQGLITHHEKGGIIDPDPQRLRAFASIYSKDFEEMVDVLVAEKYGLENRAKRMEVEVLSKEADRILAQLQKATSEYREMQDKEGVKDVFSQKVP